MDNPHKTRLTIPKLQSRPVLPQAGGSKGPVNVFSLQDAKRPKPAPKLIIPPLTNSKWRKEEYKGNDRVVRIASAPMSGDIAQATPVRAVLSTTGDKSSHVIIKSSHASISDDDFSIKSPLVPSSRKPCNCSKSRCLKLYCDCFANGAVCYNCNCVGCHNNVEHPSERSSAIQSLLSRNPSAFTPKIDERSHQKGCNCKRSACLKNYCECYGAGIPCSLLCRCEGCRNTESKFGRRRDRPIEVVNYGRRERGSLQEFEEYILSTTERIQEYKARKQSDPRII